MTPETQTDRHWNDRAGSVAQDHEVNLMDVFQRELEFDEICADLQRDMNVLEVGCGNGFSTDRFRSHVNHIDAFDKSHEMIERAKRTFSERNNRFFEDDILAPRSISGQYDCVICVRVLINLPDTQSQKTAIRNMAATVRAGGSLLLAEGFADGFEELTELRSQVGLPPLEPARINHYSSWADIAPVIAESFEVDRTWHLGMYDCLTRVLYPLVVGAENARHNTNFSESCHRLARITNPDAMGRFSRMRGFRLRRRSD